MLHVPARWNAHIRVFANCGGNRLDSAFTLVVFVFVLAAQIDFAFALVVVVFMLAAHLFMVSYRGKKPDVLKF